MKKALACLAAVFFLAIIVAGLVSAKDEANTKFAAGDTVYVCPCGAGCDCGTVSMKAGGKCTCGKDLVKTTISRVAKGKIYYEVNGQKLSAPAKGKYACACGAGCACGTISQKPGKCVCGKDMKKVS